MIHFSYLRICISLFKHSLMTIDYGNLRLSNICEMESVYLQCTLEAIMILTNIICRYNKVAWKYDLWIITLARAGHTDLTDIDSKAMFLHTVLVQSVLYSVCSSIEVEMFWL